MGNDNDSESTLGISDKSDDDMMNRGKPAVVLGYQTNDKTGERKPCVMLGMIANRDLDGYEDLLDPDNKPNRYGNDATRTKSGNLVNKAGVKTVRFNLNVQYINPKTSYEDLYNQDHEGPTPRAGVFRKTHRDEIKRLRTPVRDHIFMYS